MENNFDDIRPHSDTELSVVLSRLLNDRIFISGMREAVFHNVPSWLAWPTNLILKHILKERFKTVKTIDEFQKKITVDTFLKPLIRKTTAGVTQSGLENLSRDEAYIYMTNHRDIVLDSALLNYVLVSQSFEIAQIAFGDNLLINDTVSDLIRIKSLEVKKPPFERADRGIKTFKIYKSCYYQQGVNMVAQREGRLTEMINQPCNNKMLHLHRDMEERFQPYIIH